MARSRETARSRNKRRIGVAIAGCALALGVAGLALRGSAAKKVTSEARMPAMTIAPRASAAIVGSPARGAVPQPSEAPRAAADAPRDPAGRLRDGLGADDVAKKIAAVEAASDDDPSATLPVLTSVDITHEPETAPTIIHAVAKLGARGTRSERESAVTTLSQWLEQETKRTDLDSIGNVPNIVEALGEAGGSDAAMALANALDARRLELSVETLAVQKLGDLGDRRTRGAIERFRERLTSLPEGDDFDRELRHEAAAAADGAIAKIGR